MIIVVPFPGSDRIFKPKSVPYRSWSRLWTLESPKLPFSTRALRDVTEKHGGSYCASAVGEVKPRGCAGLHSQTASRRSYGCRVRLLNRGIR